MSKPEDTPSLRRFVNPVTLLLAALLILVGCLPFAAAVTLYTLHSKAEMHRARDSAAKTATLLLHGFERSIEPIDALMQNFAATFEAGWTPEQAYDALSAVKLPSSIIQLSVTDRNGRLIASSLSAPTGTPVNLSDREHIRVHMEKNSPHGDLFISKPVLGRVSNTWTVQLTRPLDDGQGNFGGVVVASYAIADFIEYFKQLRLEDNMLIALVGDDGIVRARAAKQTSFGDDISNTPAFQRTMQSREASYDFKSTLDGVERIGEMIHSKRYPVSVTVAYSKDFVQQQSDSFRTAIWGTALGLAIALLILVLLANRYVGMQKRLNAQELEAQARQREADVLGAISRVPGISVLHVGDTGPSEVSTVPASPMGSAVCDYARSGRFRALAAGLKAPVVRNEHLSDGMEEWEVEMVVAPVKSLDTERPSPGRKEVVVFALDQTSRRMEENKLYQMSKLASLGEVATGLAHEINQPLGVIRLAATNALTAMKQGAASDYLTAKLDRIIQQTERMGRIIDHMRIFGRNSDDMLQPCGAMDAVHGALQVLGERIRLDGIRLETRFALDVPPVLCRQDQLEQVLINLLQNARDAIIEAAARGESRQGRIGIDVAREKGPEGARGVRIAVSDNAGGIPQDIMERIFQPFFTTKPPGKGTGLGLSVSFGIIRNHGGTLSVRNGAEGAVFIICLPAKGAGAPHEAPLGAADAAATATEG
ncbi:ATP-binding protein [Xanthobacter sp. V2C-8]|uniref:ATP-binding protein n=1 Tax=Xanthobacter albus TaxID=3119929 RepID=UPI00372C8187